MGKNKVRLTWPPNVRQPRRPVTLMTVPLDSPKLGRRYTDAEVRRRILGGY